MIVARMAQTLFKTPSSNPYETATENCIGSITTCWFRCHPGLTRFKICSRFKTHQPYAYITHIQYTYIQESWNVSNWTFQILAFSECQNLTMTFCEQTMAHQETVQRFRPPIAHPWQVNVLQYAVPICAKAPQMWLLFDSLMMTQLHLLYLTVIFVCLAEGYWFGQRPWRAYQEVLWTARTILNWMGSFGTSSAVFVGPDLWARSFCCLLQEKYYTSQLYLKRQEGSTGTTRSKWIALSERCRMLALLGMPTKTLDMLLYAHKAMSRKSMSIQGAVVLSLMLWPVLANLIWGHGKYDPRITTRIPIFVLYTYNSTLCTFIWCIF